MLVEHAVLTIIHQVNLFRNFFIRTNWSILNSTKFYVRILYLRENMLTETF